MEEFKRREVLISFRRFTDYGHDLLDSNFASFETHLAIFIHFCETDKIMSSITKQLKGYDYDTWKDRFDKSGTCMTGSAEFVLPINEDDRLSLSYQILLNANAKKFDAHTFSIMAFASGSDLTDCINDFNKEITKPFIRDISYRLEEIKENIKEDSAQMISLEKLIIIKTGDIENSQISIGENIKQEKILDERPK